jgi:hypothetical protein
VLGDFMARAAGAVGLVCRAVPVLAIVVLSAPGWLVWLFLGAERRASAIEMVRELAAWTRGAASAGGAEKKALS